MRQVRTIWKLSKADGREIWTTSETAFGDTTNSHGAWEMVSVGPSGVLLAGFSKLAIDAQVQGHGGCRDTTVR